jgi:hypothetical protein
VVTATLINLFFAGYRLLLCTLHPTLTPSKFCHLNKHGEYFSICLSSIVSTIPLTMSRLTLLYLSSPYSTRTHATLPYRTPTVPYFTLPYLTLPYLTLPLPSLVGTATGCIRIYNWPPRKNTPENPGPGIDNSKLYTEISAHSTGVVSIHESPLGTHLVSVGE